MQRSHNFSNFASQDFLCNRLLWHINTKTRRVAVFALYSPERSETHWALAFQEAERQEPGELTGRAGEKGQQGQLHETTRAATLWARALPYHWAPARRKSLHPLRAAADWPCTRQQKTDRPFCPEEWNVNTWRKARDRELRHTQGTNPQVQLKYSALSFSVTF